jgi:hypothetical protein
MNNYLKEAREFLSRFQISLVIREAIPQKAPLWTNEDEKEDYGKNYWVELRNKEGKKYSFNYWGSINDKYQNKRPNAYDVLACLNSYDDGSNYDDFCSSYGYETDSIKAAKTYKAVMKQIEGLKTILSPEALEALNNID